MRLRFHIVSTVVAAALILLLAIIYRTELPFVAIAVPVAVCLMAIAAFNAHRIRLLQRTITKLDELLRLLERTHGDLSSRESQALHDELSEIRAALLRGQSLRVSLRRR